MFLDHMNLRRRNLMRASVAAAVGAGVPGVAAAQKDRDSRETVDADTDTEGAPSVVGDLKRFSTTAFGAEMTGPFVFDDGTLLHSIQHPSRENSAPWNKAGVGYYTDFGFEFDGTNDDFEEPSPPEGSEQDYARAADAEFTYLIQEGDEINDGSEQWGITQTPDGEPVTTDNFAGTTYGESGYNPDCNQFVATSDDGTEGFLFTNDENSPGNVMRTPISRTDDGEWEVDADDAFNTVNTPQFRELGGGKRRGDLWGGTLLEQTQPRRNQRRSQRAVRRGRRLVRSGVLEHGGGRTPRLLSRCRAGRGGWRRQSAGPH